MCASPDPSPWIPPGGETLVRAGFDVFGFLTPKRYDALVPERWRSAELLPETRSVVIVGNGGRALFEVFRASAEAGRGVDPIDAYTRRVIEAAAPDFGSVTRVVFPFERRGGHYADFVALARAADLGAASRLGMLLHPVYGPWFALRAAVLVSALLEAPPAPGRFDPCPGCPAPCAAACPISAPSATGFDQAGCAANRARDPGCRLRCDARRACVIGTEHAYTEFAEAHHMRHVPIEPSRADGTC